MPHSTDLDLTAKDVSELASPDAIASLFARLGYDTDDRALLSPEAVGLADATAAEVATSVNRYEQARQSLAGYQIVLDFLVAQHFGLPQAKEMVEMGSHLDLSSPEKFQASLHDEEERQLVAEVEALAQRPDRRFFHWEIEFPEVFFGFIDADQRQIRHKDEIKDGTAGFDCVVGNPPYVRQEVIKPLKPYLKTRCQTFDSTNDLYVYFQEIEIRNLRVAGRMGMIVANKWMRSGYGERLRDFLQRTGQPLEVIDFGHSPIFPDADTFPCILLMTKRSRPLADKEAPSEAEAMVACEVPREHWHDRMDLRTFVSGRRHQIPTRLLRKEGWSLENQHVQALLEKIRTCGMPLRQYIGSNIYRGVLTGCNQAFYIDEDTRRSLIVEDPASSDLIKPQLRGQDIGRWRPASSGVHVIFARRGTEILRYPAVLRHLRQFKDELEPRPQDWDERRQGTWPGRKPGPYEWFEIQDSTAYYPLFAKPKIVVQCIGYHSRWALDENGQYVNNKTFFLPNSDPILLAFLNSPLLWWFMWRVFPHMKDEALSIDGECIELLPVAPTSNGSLIHDVVQKLLRTVENVSSTENDFVGELERTAAINGSRNALVQCLGLTPEECRSRLERIERNLPQATLTAAVNLQQRLRKRHRDLLHGQLELERTLASLVEDAYGLTADERELLRSTRPVRDPLDVLEAKLRGSQEREAVNED